MPGTYDTRGTRLRVHSEGVYNVAPPLYVVPGVMRQRVERPSYGLRVNCRPSPAVRERRWRNFARTGYKKRARGSAHTPSPRFHTHPIRRKPRSPGRAPSSDLAPPRVPVQPPAPRRGLPLYNFSRLLSNRLELPRPSGPAGLGACGGLLGSLSNGLKLNYANSDDPPPRPLLCLLHRADLASWRGPARWVSSRSGWLGAF